MPVHDPIPKVSVRFDTRTQTAVRVQWGWAHIPHPDPAIHQIHVMPLSDVGVHSFDLICSCGCHEDDPGFIHHNAYDGRERYETGQEKMH
jgi:hypothetical protein